MLRSLKRPLAAAFRQVLSMSGRTLINQDRLAELTRGEAQALTYISQLEGALRELGVLHLPERSGRHERLADLIGTAVSEGFYICEALHQTSAVKGAVCEFGVAQGATSALLAFEILETGRHLWLYDSFEGLPAPTEKDELIDDIFNLGAIDHYQGTMRCAPDEVAARLLEVAFPEERCHVVEGWFKNSRDTAGPTEIAFAYVDFDFYQPILDALRFVGPRIQQTGIVIVDDYGSFSAGAKTAVDEFVAAHHGEWEFELPCGFCGRFCILKKRG